MISPVVMQEQLFELFLAVFKLGMDNEFETFLINKIKELASALVAIYDLFLKCKWSDELWIGVGECLSSISEHILYMTTM